MKFCETHLFRPLDLDPSSDFSGLFETDRKWEWVEICNVDMFQFCHESLLSFCPSNFESKSPILAFLRFLSIELGNTWNKGKSYHYVSSFWVWRMFNKFFSAKLGLLLYLFCCIWNSIIFKILFHNSLPFGNLSVDNVSFLIAPCF